MGSLHQLRRRSIARLECSSCGASADASCNCGAPYVPAGMRAAAAIEANPDKSDRAIATDLGVGKDTVRRARKPTGARAPVDAKRRGKDGKLRRMPVRPPAPVSDPTAEVNAFHRELVGFLTDFTQRFNAWHEAEPLISKDGKAALMQAFYLCADGFARLAQKLDGR
jgi:hypothetical protein